MFSVKASALLAAAMGLFVVARTAYIEEDVGGYHFHTYYFEGNTRNEQEAMDFRKATRARIQEGFLSQCSLNMVHSGIDHPHPYGHYELCCNATSFPQAMAWTIQNHGNLSVLIHPLTKDEQLDHTTRAIWVGASVPLNTELVTSLPQPRPCPVYPEYADEIPRSMGLSVHYVTRLGWVVLLPILLQSM